MNEFRFLEWPVYNDVKQIVQEIFLVTSKFPQHFRIELGSQLNRAVISILLNIAEGSGKSSDKDFSRFLNISIGSINETVAGLDIARDSKLITDKDFANFSDKLFNIAKQLGGFKKKLKRSF